MDINFFNLAVWISACIMIFGTMWYCNLIIKDKIPSPPLATFIVATVTFVLAIFMYSKKPEFSVKSNIALFSSALSAFIVLLVLFVKIGSDKIVFNNLQKGCLLFCLGIVMVWFITDNPFVSYVLLQINALISYLPVYERNLKAQRNQDSFILWTSILFSNIVASYAVWEKGDLESWIFIARAVPSTLLVVLLMVRLELKTTKYR